MDLTGNKRRDGNADMTWAIQFANLIIGITYVQWLSTLSHYLGDNENIGWALTFLFAISYLFLIKSFQKMHNPELIYRHGFWKTLREYSFSAAIVVIIFRLFIPVSSYSENVPSVFVSNVNFMIISWLILIFIIIPTLNAEKERVI
jgi:hypothetical protein